MAHKMLSCGHPDQASQRRVRLPARPIARAHDRRPEHQRASAKAPGMHDVGRGARQWDRFGSSRAPLLRCERRVAALQRCQRRRELAVPLLLHLRAQCDLLTCRFTACCSQQCT